MQKGCKRKLSNMYMLIKQKSPSLLRNFAFRTFRELPIVFSTKGNLLYLLYSMAWRCYLLHQIKQNCLLTTFLITLLISQIFFYLFFLLELIWECIFFSVTHKLVKKVIMNIDLSKASCPDCIPVVVLKNSEPELSYILAKLQ